MPDHMPHSVRDNIQLIIRMEEEQSRERSLSDRIGDAIGTFAGTVTFVVLHLVFFAAWAVFNAGMFGLPQFDPYPFQLLCMIVSMEGVLLSTFVLIKQNRMSIRSDRRNHLDLQVNLLTEQEVTKVIQMLEVISKHLGVEAEAVDNDAREMGQATAVDDLAAELKETLPADA